MLFIIKKIDKNLKKGGKILIRDYGLYDYSMIRAHQHGNLIKKNLYKRGDNTLAYYFSKDFLKDLFEI
jgi:methyltransferase-like protein 6